jgi:hypothetical protein
MVIYLAASWSSPFCRSSLGEVLNGALVSLDADVACPITVAAK